jgi:hypothetical protein
MSHPAEALDDPGAPAHVWASLAIDLQGPVRTNVSYAANYDSAPHDVP